MVYLDNTLNHTVFQKDELNRWEKDLYTSGCFILMHQTLSVRLMDKMLMYANLQRFAPHLAKFYTQKENLSE